MLWYPGIPYNAPCNYGIFRYIYPSQISQFCSYMRGAYCMGMNSTLEAFLQTLFGCAVQYGWTWGPGKQPARQDDVGLLLRVSWMLRPSHPEVEATNKWKPEHQGTSE